jgi:hypothetical protein
MSHAVLRLVLPELPVQVIASHIMPMLDIKELVALDSVKALSAQGLLQEVQNLIPPITLPPNLDLSVARWLLQHGYNVVGGLFPYWKSSDADEQRWIMEQHCDQFRCMSLRLPNMYLKTTKILRRCSTVELAGPLTSLEVATFMENAFNVTDLTVTGNADQAQPDLVQRILMAAPKLKRLSCSCKSLHAALSPLAITGTTLKELLLSDLRADINAEIFADIAALCPNLEHVGEADHNEIGYESAVDEVILAFAERCRNLKSVSLRYNWLTTPALRQLFSKCRGLRCFSQAAEWLSEDVLAAAECGARLNSIPLYHALPGDLETYTMLFVHLRNVHMYYDFLVSLSAVAAASCMRRLDSVVLDCGCLDEAVDLGAVLQAIAATCTQLRSLSCSGKYVTDIGFASALAAVLASNRRISTLWIGDSRNDMVVVSMPQVLADALATCYKLRYVTLEWYDVTDNQMLPMVVSMRALERCVLPAATNLTDSFLLTLTQYCRNLSRLCVTKCSQFTEAAVVHLIHRSAKLTDLEVYRDRISPATGAALIAEKRLYKLKVTQWS